MTAEQSAGAVSHDQVNWQTIDWQTVHQNVRRLQARIVKATQEGKWGKVKALQHLLTRSFSGKALAVRRVTENQGKRTPGVDKETWETPAKKAAAIQALKQRGYTPLPLRRVYILKSDGESKRPLGIPTMKDRAMQALYLLALEPVAETTADPHSYGFRRERSTHDALAHSFNMLGRKHMAEWVLEGDIKACFDKISHEWLMTHIPMEKVMLRKWLKAGYMEKGILHPTEDGTPQGGIISPTLANMALDGLESVLRKAFPYTSNYTSKVNFIRYADDFIITGKSKEILEQQVTPTVQAFLRERGLELSTTKTQVTHIEEGFDFLGQNIRKYSNGKVLTKPSKKSVKRILKKIRDIIKTNKAMSPGLLIGLLNPALRGWAYYHRHAVSKRIFRGVDAAVFKAIWRWCVRRHPKKGKRWIRAKYFKSDATRSWVFHGELNGADRTLFQCVTVPIQRHSKLKSEANPFDPQWEIYFEERLGLKMAHNLKGRKKLLHLWHEQNGICPICNQKITTITGWHNHHIIWRTHGGSDSSENRVLLHPVCHQQVHSLDVTVKKPRPTKKGERKA